MDIVLTKDAERLFALLCKSHKEKRKQGLSLEECRSLGDMFSINSEYMTGLTLEGTRLLCDELKASGLIDFREVDGAFHMAELTPVGISFMESKFRRGLEDILDFLSKFL